VTSRETAVKQVMSCNDASSLEIAIGATQRRIHEINEAKGWYETQVEFLPAMALLHSEVSEAVEAWRNWGLLDQTPDGIVVEDGRATLPKPEGVGSELADVFIRLLDDADLFGIDLAAEVERKLAYNAVREYRHGGKRA
jgi:NTP pyrophosphatase (non-canonical NTP hydrolase)